MITIFEDTVMVNPIHNTVNGKTINTDERLKNKESASSSESLLSKFSPNADDVSLSQSSRQLEALKASLKDTPEINEARVAYFKSEIAQGNYQINSSNIAKKMLNVEETV